MYGLIMAAAVVLGQNAPIVATPERQKQLLAEYHAEVERSYQASLARRAAEAKARPQGAGQQGADARPQGKPQGIDRAALEERLKVDPYYEPDPSAAGAEPLPLLDDETLGDQPKPKPKKPSKKARYRAYNARFEAEQAAEARRLREYQAKMAPIWAEQQARQQELQMRQYEIELRHRDNLDFNDAIRGVTRPR